MRLDQTERERFIVDHPHWNLTGEQMSRTFEFEGFPQSVAFVVQVAFAAEEADHHPDIDIRWNKVTLELSTHSEGALTAKDTDLAAAIEKLTATA